MLEIHKSRVVSTLRGGLGNQMFQYAAARALALRLGIPLELDISYCRKGRNRDYGLHCFPIKADVARRPMFLNKAYAKVFGPQIFEEHDFSYDARIADISAPVRLEGYFQSWRYFERYADEIRFELAPESPHDDATLALGEKISGEDAISLHIRRGDYVNDPRASALYSQCTLAYYREAFSRLPADLPAYVFTDDLVWAKAHLDFGRPLIFTGERRLVTALGDLWLMTKASHHIIANSTFSWWGAWLKSGNGTTIAPSPWFKTNHNSDVDLVPHGWMKIAL